MIGSSGYLRQRKDVFREETITNVFRFLRWHHRRFLSLEVTKVVVATVKVAVLKVNVDHKIFVVDFGRRIFVTSKMSLAQGNNDLAVERRPTTLRLTSILCCSIWPLALSMRIILRALTPYLS